MKYAEQVIDLVAREMQSSVDGFARANRGYKLGLIAEGAMIALVSGRDIVVKIDLVADDGIFCRITDVPAMQTYMRRAGGVKAWDDSPIHTTVVRDPLSAVSSLDERLRTAFLRFSSEFDKNKIKRQRS